MPLFNGALHRPLFAFPERVTEATVRLVAGGVSLTILVGFALQVGWVLPLLAVGFALRVGAGPRFSPLARLAILVTDVLRLPTRTIAGAPKQFAAAIGATVLTTASALFAAGLCSAAWTVAGLVAVLAGLEALFAFCLGCKLYTALFGCADCSAPDRTSGSSGGSSQPPSGARQRRALRPDEPGGQPFLLIGHDGALGLAALARRRWFLPVDPD